MRGCNSAKQKSQMKKKITENTVDALRLGVEKDAHSRTVRILSR